MKKTFIGNRIAAFVLTLTIVISCAGAVPLGAAASAEQSFDGYILNGDFETGTAGAWNIPATYSVVAGGHDGSGYCLRVAGSAYSKAHQDVNVEPNTDYRFSGWVKREAGVGAHYFNANGNSVSTLETLNSTNPWHRYVTPDWFWFVWDFNSGDNTTINVRIDIEDAASICLYDDINLRKLEPSSVSGYLNNGNFETGAASGWLLTAAASVVAGGRNGSSYALKVDGAGEKARQFFRVEGMTDYRVTVHTKRVSGEGSHQLRVSKANSGAVLASAAINDASSDWEEHVVEFNTGATAQITLALESLEGEASFLYDDVKIEKIKKNEPDYSAVEKGDANGDYNVDESDLAVLESAVADGTVLEGAAAYAADMNYDGAADEADLALLRAYLSLEGSKALPLYPASGETVAKGAWQVEELLHDYYPGKSDEYTDVYFGLGTHKDTYKRDDVVLRWTCTIPQRSYTVLLADNPELENARTYTAQSMQYTLQNLLVDTDYYWAVEIDGILSSVATFHTAKTVRTFWISGVSNGRDLGGWLTEDGLARVRYDVAFRAAHFDHITDAGRTAVAELGLKTDIDLRADGEGLTAPLGDGVTWLRAGPDGGAMYYSKDGGNSISKLTGSYTQATINALRVFADASNLPACFHCSYGRDRTGTVGVLLLGLLGVSYYDIVCDYEITFLTSVMGDKNTTIRSDEAVTKMMNWIMENYPADSLKESTELYLLAAGLKDSEILAIRKNLLETADGEPLKAESIEVTTLPRRLAFLEGKGKLNVVGGMITVRYNTGITESIWMDKSMVSGFDNTVVGPQTLTVSYMGATTTYEVEITPKSITGITLTSLPAKLEYKEGEEFDPAGLEVTADYDNGDRAALTDADYSIAGFESVAGEHTITVSAGGFTATFTVTVTKGVKRGDADGDGEITVADALVALRIAAKLRDSTPELLAVCDVDGDGEITVADALKILRVAAKLTDESALA